MFVCSMFCVVHVAVFVNVVGGGIAVVVYYCLFVVYCLFDASLWLAIA